MLASSVMVLGITAALAAGPTPPSAAPPTAMPTSAATFPQPDSAPAGSSPLRPTDENATWVDRLLPRPDWSSLQRAWFDWLAPAPRTDRDIYEARTQPYAMQRFWIGGAVTRLLVFLTPTTRTSMLGVARFDVLSAIPVIGEESSPFGYRRHPISKRRKLHKGLDIAAPRGTPVHAAGPGEVTFAGRKRGYGNVIYVSHGLGLETRYAHLRRIHVETRQFVAAGDKIGTVGATGRATGPHLHFEVRQFGEPLNPKWALGVLQPSVVDEARALWSWLRD